MSKEKKLVIQIAIFALVLVSITLIYNFLVSKGKDDVPTSVNKGGSKVEIMQIDGEEKFQKEVLDVKGTVFVDFYATWCMPCKVMEPVIKEVSQEYTNVKFVKVDIDKNEELAIKYDVMSIPTMIIFRDGEVSKTFIGVVDKEKIVKEL